MWTASAASFDTSATGKKSANCPAYRVSLLIVHVRLCTFSQFVDGVDEGLWTVTHVRRQLCDERRQIGRVGGERMLLSAQRVAHVAVHRLMCELLEDRVARQLGQQLDTFGNPSRVRHAHG